MQHNTLLDNNPYPLSFKDSFYGPSKQTPRNRLDCKLKWNFTAAKKIFWSVK